MRSSQLIRNYLQTVMNPSSTLRLYQSSEADLLFTDSTHYLADAIDYSLSEYYVDKLYQHLIDIGESSFYSKFELTGIGFYTWGIHIDNSPTHPRRTYPRHWLGSGIKKKEINLTNNWNIPIEPSIDEEKESKKPKKWLYLFLLIITFKIWKS